MILEQILMHSSVILAFVLFILISNSSQNRRSAKQ